MEKDILEHSRIADLLGNDTTSVGRNQPKMELCEERDNRMHVVDDCALVVLFC